MAIKQWYQYQYQYQYQVWIKFGVGGTLTEIRHSLSASLRIVKLLSEPIYQLQFGLLLNLTKIYNLRACRARAATCEVEQ